MTPVERLLATARAEVGYLEKASNKDLDDKTANAGYGNWTKYARDLDNMGRIYNGKKNGFDWCDVFVDWCFIHTFGEELGMALLCQAYQGLGAGTKYSANYYKTRGQYHEVNPRPGDQIFFGDGKTMWHTGIVTDVRNGRVYTIEGNTTTAAGVIPNGGGVVEKSYSLTYAYIDGYGRPDWSLVKEDDDMDEAKFDEMFEAAMGRYRAKLQGKDGSPWSQEDRDWSVENGLFQGGGDDKFMWQDLSTREQLASLFHRFYGVIEKMVERTVSRMLNR